MRLPTLEPEIMPNDSGLQLSTHYCAELILPIAVSIHALVIWGIDDVNVGTFRTEECDH